MRAKTRPERARLAAMGRRIRLARRTRQWTQQTLARACGFQPQVVSRVERGASDVLAQSLADVARALGVTTDYLLGLSSEMSLVACDEADHHVQESPHA